MSDPTQERAEEALRSAEEALNRWAREARDFTARALARAREEAEDIWAEAREVNRRGPPGDGRA